LETKELILVTGVSSGVSNGVPVKSSLAAILATQGQLSSDPKVKADRLICIDYSSEAGRHIRLQGLVAESCTLIRMEPSVVHPANFFNSRSKQFGDTITVGGRPTSHSASVNWPLVYPAEAERKLLQSAERTERTVLINGNKISFVDGELYSLRRMAIRALENLDLYGTEWDSTILNRLFIAARSFAHAVLNLKAPRVSGIAFWFQSYPLSKGPVRDKLKTMSKYKYALVIENSAEYMSEKLMEALFAGCIPIYVGPDPQEYGIPSNLVIWSKPNIGSIRSSLENATTWDLRDFHSRLEVFLGSSETRDLWQFEKVYQKVLELIQKGSK
jgi:hypothetical protein